MIILNIFITLVLNINQSINKQGKLNEIENGGYYYKQTIKFLN